MIRHKSTLRFSESTPFADPAGFEPEFISPMGILTFDQPSFDSQLIIHDVFEHRFECCDIFSTGGLHVEGEAFALGIRQYLVDEIPGYSHYIAYNKSMGCLNNSLSFLFSYDSDYSYEYECKGSFTSMFVGREHKQYFKHCFQSFQDRQTAHGYKYVKIGKLADAFAAGYATAEKLYGYANEEKVLNMAKSLTELFNYLSSFDSIIWELNRFLKDSRLEITFIWDGNFNLSFEYYFSYCDINQSTQIFEGSSVDGVIEFPLVVDWEMLEQLD